MSTSFLNNGVALINKTTAAPAPANKTRVCVKRLHKPKQIMGALPPQRPIVGTHVFRRCDRNYGFVEKIDAMEE